MAFSESITIAHRPDEVFPALVDEAFTRQVTEKLGGTLVAFELQGDPAGAVHVTMVRSVPVNRLPEAVQKFAGKFLGDKLSLEQSESWSAPGPDGSRTGQVVFSVPTAKTTARVEQRLSPTEGGSEIAVTGSVECRIPLVGNKLAQAAEPRVGSVLRRQAR